MQWLRLVVVALMVVQELRGSAGSCFRKQPSIVAAARRAVGSAWQVQRDAGGPQVRAPVQHRQGLQQAVAQVVLLRLGMKHG